MILNKILVFIFLLLFILFILFIFSKNKNTLPNNSYFNPINNWYDLYEAIFYLSNKNKLLKYNKILPKYVSKRNLIPIKNKYEIIKLKYDISDYHFILYYLNDYETKIIIRRLDNLYIENDFYLKIYDDDDENKFELIKFNKIESNEINTIIQTKTKLYKIDIDNSQLIPKIIIQTAKNNICSFAEYNAVMTFIDLNPEYEYMFFNNDDCIDFLNKNFDKNVCEAYDNLIPGAYKADLFRCCILKKIGGCYFDIKQINRTPLREFILAIDELVLCKDLADAYYNALMCAIPNNSSINLLIDNIIENVKNKYYGTCSLCPTGPCLLYKLITNYKPTLFNKCDNILIVNSKLRHKCFIYSNKIKKIICNTSYYGYYERNFKSTYGWLWITKKIYK